MDRPWIAAHLAVLYEGAGDVGLDEQLDALAAVGTDDGKGVLLHPPGRISIERRVVQKLTVAVMLSLYEPALTS